MAVDIYPAAEASSTPLPRPRPGDLARPERASRTDRVLPNDHTEPTPYVLYMIPAPSSPGLARKKPRWSRPCP